MIPGGSTDTWLEKPLVLKVFWQVQWEKIKTYERKCLSAKAVPGCALQLLNSGASTLSLYWLDNNCTQQWLVHCSVGPDATVIASLWAAIAGGPKRTFGAELGIFLHHHHQDLATFKDRFLIPIAAELCIVLIVIANEKRDQGISKHILQLTNFSRSEDLSRCCTLFYIPLIPLCSRKKNLIYFLSVSMASVTLLPFSNSSWRWGNRDSISYAIYGCTIDLQSCVIMLANFFCSFQCSSWLACPVKHWSNICIELALMTPILFSW